MTIHWDDAAIPWLDVDSTAKDVLALSQHNAPFNSERKIMNASSMLNNSKADIKPSQKAPLILIFKKEMSYTRY